MAYRSNDAYQNSGTYPGVSRILGVKRFARPVSPVVSNQIVPVESVQRISVGQSDRSNNTFIRPS